MMHKYRGFTVTYSAAVITQRRGVVMYAADAPFLLNDFITLH